MIRGYRESLGLKKKPFARLMRIEPNLLRAWEADQERININSWNKYFKDKIKVHLLDQVFASFCDDADSLDFAFDNGQVCRWFNGQARISPRFPLPLVH